MKIKRILVFLAIIVLSHCSIYSQDNGFSNEEIQAVLKKGSGISGPGSEKISSSIVGWRSGYEGAMYKGPNPKPGWISMPTDMAVATGLAVKEGLIPPVKPLLELHIRDTKIILGGDGYYYMTGSTGDNIWAFNDGIELWKSPDLVKWEYMGLVWTIEKDGTWEKQWVNRRGKPVRAIWAPEILFIKNNYVIVLSMPNGGITILKSTSGKPEGPYVHTSSDNKPLVSGIDGTLFQDDDGAVYFTWSNASRIARMKDDLSGFAESFHDIILEDPDTVPSHHNAGCVRRGMKDLGFEGAVLFKANGKYYLGAVDLYEERYSSCVAISDNVYGPYHGRHETVPCGGGTGFFKDKNGRWWCSFFGNDWQAPFREMPAIIPVLFDKEGKIHPDFSSK